MSGEDEQIQKGFIFWEGEKMSLKSGLGLICAFAIGHLFFILFYFFLLLDHQYFDVVTIQTKNKGE